MKGSCLCGAVQYEITGLDSPIETCSCRMCRKAHAAPNQSAAGVYRENFKWLAGEDLLTDYEASEGKKRRFCSRCGSHILAEYDHRPRLVLRVATLDEDPGQRPAFHIWKSHEVSWLTPEEDIPSFDGWKD